MTQDGMRPNGVKAILGYEIIEGMTPEEYDEWIWEVHVPDLLANPHIDRIVFDTVVRPITQTSAGTPITDDPVALYRIAELHFADHDAYDAWLRWFEEHPVPVERSPFGRTDFKFYVLTDSVVAERDAGFTPPAWVGSGA
jgi:hypothetical protein